MIRANETRFFKLQPLAFATKMINCTDEQTFTNVSGKLFLVMTFAALSKSGINLLQWAHQGATNSTNAVSSLAISLMKLSSVSSSIALSIP